MTVYQNLGVVLSWISLPVCLVFVVLILRMNAKYRTRKKELASKINSPEMTDLRWFFKEELKKYGIKAEKPVVAMKNNDEKSL